MRQKRRVSVDDFPPPGNARHPPVALACAAADVALWWAPLAVAPDEIARLAAWLAPAEHARAARFGREALAHRYIVGRALLRWLLGRTLGLAPRAVPIGRGLRGRPQLDLNTDLDFNVSHTAGSALVGMTRGRRIGVDVERVDRVVRADGLAAKFLTAAEQATLAPLPEHERRVRFLRYWTCKEAMSKATGDGLAAPFRELEVQLGDAIELAAGPEPYQPARWQLAQVAAPDGFLATVALWSATL
jgi:4'-phosphopantetheinyl transferase